MALRLVQEQLPFRSANGEMVATLHIAIECDDSVDALRQIDAEEAELHGEQRVQLLEGHSYEYALDKPGFELEEQRSLITRLALASPDRDCGLIAPGLRTGMLTLNLVRGGSRCASASVEVRSLKLGYREDYRAMLEDIADSAIDLLLQITSPSMVRLSHDEASDTSTLLQRFFFVKSVLEGAAFVQSMQQILASPHNALTPATEDVLTNRGVRATPAVVRQIASRFPRIPLPTSHPFAQRLLQSGIENASVPRTVAMTSYEETVDTFENQFIKYVLSSFSSFLVEVETALKARGKVANEMASRDVVPLRKRLEDTLSSELFSEVSELTTAPISTPVLQRKPGYREMYQAWSRFHAAARLIWSGGDDVYGAGKRDVAMLYEYWLFFVLLGIVHEWAPEAINNNTHRILRSAEDGFGLTLKQGELLETCGTPIERKGRKFRLQFSYNRTFRAASMDIVRGRLEYRRSYPNEGSWTRSMRPDFTISFWDEGLSRQEAEAAERIVHIHFDAKYSVADIFELFGADDDDLQTLKRQERAGTFKRADLLKMHTYKDSIRRSQGAYVLFPGVELRVHSDGTPEYESWLGFREILPGVGAFAVRPGPDKKEAVSQIAAFLEDVIDHLSDPKSIREQIAALTAELNSIEHP